jgi:RNA polymerase sigma-70 factor (ECF subfamily)
MMRASRDSFSPPAAPLTEAESRLASIIKTHYAAVWRVVRRLGVSEVSAEDAVQQTFVIASTRLDRIDARAERAFLLGTAARIAANLRRSAVVRYESPEEDIGRRAADVPGAEELLDEKRLRELFDEVLAGLPDELRTVLVLFELEDVDMADIATALGIPRGTVASRLRRARAAFAAAARRTRARLRFKET